ncbi:PREDICTED: uncharacterized protein LOC107186370 [Dufourea novaeangliae]|uniref:Uncharacterized protein n=1 Tax=Dufourea novaeangliae TaxID=178035 RepID=A0A154PAE4_DUFNO|nr:PREDICTED: uncharacterized protein LOC107186370 [Dufourea novaeangliae]KZC08198.1 hypothetical protein WN55_10069 [Dufourea novaeangliae]
MAGKGRPPINTVFPSCQDEVKELEPIVFHVPATYNSKVKIHDWQLPSLAEPRDNRDIFPPVGNLHKSSYKRLGPEADGTGISETQAMLSQIELKHLYAPIFPQRTLLNIKALASEVTTDRKPLTLTEAIYDPEEARRMDYRTTKENDYRLPRPIKRKPPPPPPPPEPWLLNRRTIGYSLQELEKRDGFYTFLDDDMELHRRIAELKSRRNKLHEHTSTNDSTTDHASATIAEHEKIDCP